GTELVEFILETPLQRSISGHRVVIVEQPQVMPHPQQLTRCAGNHFGGDPGVERGLQESSAVGVVSGEPTQRKTNAVRFCHDHLPFGHPRQYTSVEGVPVTVLVLLYPSADI